MPQEWGSEFNLSKCICILTSIAKDVKENDFEATICFYQLTF